VTRILIIVSIIVLGALGLGAASAKKEAPLCEAHFANLSDAKLVIKGKAFPIPVNGHDAKLVECGEKEVTKGKTLVFAKVFLGQAGTTALVGRTYLYAFDLALETDEPVLEVEVERTVEMLRKGKPIKIEETVAVSYRDRNRDGYTDVVFSPAKSNTDIKKGCVATYQSKKKVFDSSACQFPE